MPSPRVDTDKSAAQRIAELERGRRDADELFSRERGARRRLEEESRVMPRLFGVVAREVAGPANAMLSWAETLASEFHAREARLKAFATIERNAKAQLAVLDRLIDLPRVASGDVPLEVSVVEMRALVRHVVERFARGAADAGIILSCDDRTDGSAPVSADRARLEQVFANVLENATRFTPGGGAIEIVASRDDVHVEVTVADTGRGLARAQLASMFSGSGGDAGLGLYVAKRLVELHGGSVEAHSDGEGNGTTMRICLPCGSIEAADAQPRARGEVLDGARVLLVEDDLDTRDVVAAVLADRGAMVASARDGEEQRRS